MFFYSLFSHGCPVNISACHPIICLQILDKTCQELLKTKFVNIKMQQNKYPAYVRFKTSPVKKQFFSTVWFV